jgi:hypothetical protein
MRAAGQIPEADSDSNSDSPSDYEHSGLRSGDVQECETDSQLQHSTDAKDAPIAAQPSDVKSAPLDEADSDLELCARFGNSKVHPPHEWMKTSNTRTPELAENRNAIFCRLEQICVAPDLVPDSLGNESGSRIDYSACLTDVEIQEAQRAPENQCRDQQWYQCSGQDWDQWEDQHSDGWCDAQCDVVAMWLIHSGCRLLDVKQRNSGS